MCGQTPKACKFFQWADQDPVETVFPPTEDMQDVQVEEDDMLLKVAKAASIQAWQDEKVKRERDEVKEAEAPQQPRQTTSSMTEKEDKTNAGNSSPGAPKCQWITAAVAIVLVVLAAVYFGIWIGSQQKSAGTAEQEDAVGAGEGGNLVIQVVVVISVSVVVGGLGVWFGSKMQLTS